MSDYAYKYVRRYTVRFGWLENFHEPGHRDDTRWMIVKFCPVYRSLSSASAFKHRDDPNLLRNGWTPLMKFQIGPRVTNPVVAPGSFARSTL